MTTKKSATTTSAVKKSTGVTTTAAKKTAGSRSMPKSGRDPRGGLTAEGRKFFNEKEGSHLRPGVKGPADTPDKMKRKGSFLTRHFTHPRGPMEKAGEPTRLALSAQAWGEALPKTEVQAKKLAAEGRELLEEFHRAKDDAEVKKSAGRESGGGGATKKTAAKKTAGKNAVAKNMVSKKGTRKQPS